MFSASPAAATTIAASTYAYDMMGRLASEQFCIALSCSTAPPEYAITSARYDLAGNLLTLTYPDGRQVGNTYDGMNRLGSVQYQQWGAQPTSSTYWTALSHMPPGQVSSAQLGNGTQMQASYNNRQSVTNLSYQSLNAAVPQPYFSKSYQWDRNGVNLLLETDQVSSKYRQFGYDKLNRLVQAQDVSAPAGVATGTATVSGIDGSTTNCDVGESAQNSDGTQPPLVMPPGGGCTTVWDTGSVYLTIGSTTISAPYGKLSFPLKLASSLADSVNASNLGVTASATGATITLTANTAGPGGNYALAYATDGDFNITLSGSTMTGGQTAQPLPGGLNQQYTLDPWGNLSSMGSSGFSQPITTANQVQSFLYDADGRVTSTGAGSYTYDDDGMMLTSPDGAQYGYRADGQRAYVTNGSTSEYYAYFGGQLVATVSSTIGWTDMIYAGGQRVASVAGAQAAQPVYTLPDQIGSEAATVDSNANATALDYTPFGQIVSGSSPDSYIFTGLERDNSGLDHATFRQYSSTTGGWMTPDPYDGSYSMDDPQSLNRYAYARNNPLAWSDPSGLQQGTHGDGPPQYPDDCDFCNFFVDLGEDILDFFDGGGDSFKGNKDALNEGRHLLNKDGTVGPPAPSNPYAPDGPVAGQSFFSGPGYILGDPIPGTGPNKPTPCNQSRANGKALDYSQPIHKGITTMQHIQSRHMPGVGGRNVSTYWTQDWSAVGKMNYWTFFFGNQSFQGGSMIFDYTFPNLIGELMPGSGLQNGIGYDAKGNDTLTNHLVLMPDCKTVVTSYPIE